MMVFIGGLIGSDIAPSPTLATLPGTLMIAGLALSTIPAALLMKRIGRKKGFIFSALIAALAALLAASAVFKSDFNLFCLAAFVLGTNGAFVAQYRFAVLESVTKEKAGKAVSLLLLGGILAGLLGPEIVRQTRDLLPNYSGSFITTAILLSAMVIILFFINEVEVKEQASESKERPLGKIISQPLFILAALAGATGYGIMSFIMTATPIQMHKISHFSLDHTAFIIQSHIVAMFLPSLITASLIERFGVLKIIIAGLACFLLSIILAVNASDLIFYWISLVLLGFGWNFLFIGSTVLLPQSYSGSERFKAQGFNDFFVMGSQMIASFLAGSLLFSAGWINLNLLTLPLIIATTAIFIIYQKKLIKGKA